MSRQQLSQLPTLPFASDINKHNKDIVANVKSWNFGKKNLSII
jgi:hypothetical protein